MLSVECSPDGHWLKVSGSLGEDLDQGRRNASPVLRSILDQLFPLRPRELITVILAEDVDQLTERMVVPRLLASLRQIYQIVNVVLRIEEQRAIGIVLVSYTDNEHHSRQGGSSPIVAEGRMFLVSRAADGELRWPADLRQLGHYAQQFDRAFEQDGDIVEIG